MDRPLFKLFPDAARAWLPLAELPTPIEPLTALGLQEGHADLWIKRDDRTSPLYGGNKVRKLEFLLGDAFRRGARTLVTVGAQGSHHVLATARFGLELGMSTTAVVTPQAPSAHMLHNIQLGRQWGVSYQECTHPLLVPAHVAYAMLLHPRSFFVPPGGSSARGALGYVNAGIELADQLQAGLGPMPAAIVVATGSAGTHAGLILGLAIAGLEVPVVGVRVVPRCFMNETLVAGLVVATARQLGLHLGFAWARRRVRLIHDQFGPGYGIPTPEAERLLESARDLEAVSLEGTYTAKALAGALAVAGELGAGKPVLFWHTYAGDAAAPVMAEGGEALQGPHPLQTSR